MDGHDPSPLTVDGGLDDLAKDAEEIKGALNNKLKDEIKEEILEEIKEKQQIVSKPLKGGKAVKKEALESQPEEPPPPAEPKRPVPATKKAKQPATTDPGALESDRASTPTAKSTGTGKTPVLELASVNNNTPEVVSRSGRKINQPKK